MLYLPIAVVFPVFKVANQFLLTLYRQLPLRSTLLEVKVLLQEHVEDFERTVVFPSLKGVARKIMKRNWEVDELVEQFTLLASEMTLLGNKTGSTRLGFAVLLKFFQSEGRFPEHQQEVPSVVVNQISKQVGVPTELYLQYDWNGRTIKYHRAQSREFLGFHEATVQDAQNVTDWLYQRVPEYDHKIENLQAAAKERFRQLKIEPPTQARVDRLVRSAIRTYEEHFCTSTLQKLPASTRVEIDKLLGGLLCTADKAEVGNDSETETPSDLHELKADPGRVGLESIFKEIDRLQRVRQLGLPVDLFQNVSPKVLSQYRQRVAAESLHNLRRHPDPIRYTLVAAFCWLRSQEITDNLVDLLIQIVHRIGARAEKRVEKELLDEFKPNRRGVA